MTNHDHLDRRHNVLHHLTHLPRKIVSLNGAENLTEFVLHDLCQSRCFNLPKAAYFVNNPDFNCIKGVAGVHASELFQGDSWEQPHDFSAHMKQATFNQKVRGIDQCSIIKSRNALDGLVKEIAQELDMDRYAVQLWNVKHDNQGVLIFAQDEQDEYVTEEMIHAGACLLGFCPIF